ncbi:GNAT family N-acetyltransferase [Salininema proteolyticum]|uniref:Lysine N-acyltransferase MbtK n=1 Tax=Salininema proteolyticum TaxID=1607685 RepID=A0ABV8U3T9_9ACTN
MRFEIHRDDWGVPHLKADSATALAYAQGWNAAEDRAWQIEIDRHRAEGTIASVLGGEGIDWDRFAREAQITDTARRAYENLDSETRYWLDSYVQGINDGLDQYGSRAPEFDRVGTQPGSWKPWTPLAQWISTHILFAGFPVKLFRRQIAHALGENAVPLFALDGPGTAGSNGWMVEGDHTASGLPILAGDPHRFLEEPGVYQQVRLSCDEFDVVGMAVPGVPGVAHFGHAGSVAWGITNAMADTQDLYQEKLRRVEDGTEALGPEGWEPVRAWIETVEVADEDPRRFERYETKRGPIVAGGFADGRRESEAFSLRCTTRAHKDTGFSALLKLLRSTTVADVDAALADWATPVNVVMAADSEGGTLHRVAGTVPVRDRRNMLFPVPAWEDSTAWRGTVDPLPRCEKSGHHVMANERGIAEPLGVEFAAPDRADRISALLESQETWTAGEMARIHSDTFSPSSGALLSAIEFLDDLSSTAQEVRRLLLSWDRRMSGDSREAALFARFRAQVVAEIEKLPPFDGIMAGTEGFPSVFQPWFVLRARMGHVLTNLLADGNGLVGPDERDAVLRSALESTSAQERTVWKDVHRPLIWRALLTEDGLSGTDGDHDCVMSTSSVPGLTDSFGRAPVCRWAWDLSDRENSRWVVPFGASGVPGDVHARDQYPFWAEGTLIPIVTDWEKLTFESAKTFEVERRQTSVYARKVPDFGEVTFDPVDPAVDIDILHSWVTEDRARFWGMREKSKEEVQGIYEFLDALETHHAFLARLDGMPVALFQSYDPSADPVGEYYDVREGDIGCHIFIGPAADDRERRGFTGTLLRCFIEYVLSDSSKDRVVAEPDARNDKAVSRFTSVGFASGPEVRLPEKTASLMYLRREDFTW